MYANIYRTESNKLAEYIMYGYKCNFKLQFLDDDVTPNGKLMMRARFSKKMGNTFRGFVLHFFTKAKSHEDSILYVPD